jgi:ribonuclease Z
MNAENILLTHFSARYPKMPPSIVKPSERQPSENDEKEPTVGLAFDHANIQLGEFWKLNMYLPAIEQSFSDTVEEGDGEQDRLEVEWG